MIALISEIFPKDEIAMSSHAWLLAAVLSIALVAGCSGMALMTESKQSAQIQSEDMQRAERMLAQALEEAKRTGKSTVTVHVTQEDPVHVQENDLVGVDYTARLETGQVIRTTVEAVDSDARLSKAEWYLQPARFQPEEVVAGKKASVPGLGEGVTGMAPGEKRTLTVPPEKAYGLSDPNQILTFSCIKRLPVSFTMKPEAFVARFQSFPVPGNDVRLDPYLEARVREVSQRGAVLEIVTPAGTRIEDPFGSTEIRRGGDEVRVVLTPRIGAAFEVKGKKGRIVSTDGTTFAVDFNHPGAGKALVLDLEVVSVTKETTLARIELPWFEDHDKALDAAKKENKPVVLVLYAPWCSWSRKLLNESLEDPRIKSLKDQFVWVKVNSEEQKNLYEFYEQEGFPLVLLLNPEGEVLRKMDGFSDGPTLKKALSDSLSHMVAGRSSKKAM